MSILITPSEYYDELSLNMAKEIMDYTPQLFFEKNHNGKLPPYADSSSVLLTINERFFLITAAHCIYDIDCIGIMVENDFYTIGGYLKYFEPNDQDNYEPNHLDLAIFELNDETIKAFKLKYKFLDWNRIGFGHQSSTISHYLVIGYPEYKTEKHFPTKKILSSPLILRTIGVNVDKYVKDKVNKNSCIILSADQKNVGLNTTNTIIELPPLGGISGCGIWHVFNEFGKTPRYQLVAILTGENEQKTLLYSTKIDHIKKILEIHFNLKV